MIKKAAFGAVVLVVLAVTCIVVRAYLSRQS